ncbi:MULTISPECIES: hypothetical protein [Rhizobium]|uniref:hypothetical protein n=1 Tax=Rhizobium TaxID=379 RepID=UPI001409E99F|nr:MULTISPECIES: hypothetical protein [Rhizobium]MDG3578390.1 hypothetical protein [Rhizobium sp. YJ-22]
MKNAPKRETRPDMAPEGGKGVHGTERGMAMLLSSIRSVEGAVSEIEAAAEYLADLLRAAHGGTWNTSINHNTCFVVVSRDLD